VTPTNSYTGLPAVGRGHLRDVAVYILFVFGATAASGPEPLHSRGF
jgi:hypothetical protein